MSAPDRHDPAPAGDRPVPSDLGFAEPPGNGSGSAPTHLIDGLRSLLERGLELPLSVERSGESLAPSMRDIVDQAEARLRGEYSEDEWGYDEQFVEIVYPLFEFMYRYWWRIATTGAGNVPAHGRALLVANHAGVLPWDAAMMSVAIRKQHPLPRQPRAMVLDWAFRLPWVSIFMRRVGGVVASPYNAMRLLEQEHLVMAFPEGSKGAGKPFSRRYRLERFGRGGFVEVALRTGSPIVPVAVVGSEEIYPKIADSRLAAKLIGAPYFPITPTFPLLGPVGAVPLPSRWRIEFCEPLDLSGYPPEAADDRGLVLELSDRVRDTIQEKLFENLVERGSAFL